MWSLYDVSSLLCAQKWPNSVARIETETKANWIEIGPIFSGISQSCFVSQCVIIWNFSFIPKEEEEEVRNWVNFKSRGLSYFKLSRDVGFWPQCILTVKHVASASTSPRLHLWLLLLKYYPLCPTAWINRSETILLQRIPGEGEQDKTAIIFRFVP